MGKNRFFGTWFDEKKNRLLLAFIGLLIAFSYYVVKASDTPEGHYVPPIWKAIAIMGVFVYICFRISEWWAGKKPKLAVPTNFRVATRSLMATVVAVGCSLILGIFAHWMLGVLFFAMCFLMYFYPEETQEIVTRKKVS